ncbi:MAG: DNA-directed DNA polymerase II small subunit [Archaeoglobus sp.]|nr:MAG: DNA-directed DNA polymerase II small subunit [Archaeoglobus sp.]
MVIKDVDSKLIIKKFALEGFNIQPKAIEALKPFIPNEIDGIVKHICKCCSGSFIITEDDVKRILNNLKSLSDSKTVQNKVSNNVTQSVQVIKDVSGKSCCQGKIEDFVAYFNSRYDKIYSILRTRTNPVRISDLRRIRSQNVEVVGIVDDVRETSNGNAIIELEDKTGVVNVIATGKLKDEAMELLGDEVIAVSGMWNGRFIIADRIIFPDIPINGNGKRNWGFCIAFISDTHFGSATFMQEAWQRFVNFMNCETGDDRAHKLAESIKYIILAGDVVDGVGIYPGQEKELSIKDIYTQYEFAAEQIEKLPERVKVIISPGNHDAVRQAEPQPKLPEEFASLFPKNVIHVGNPALITLDGVRVQIYHGRSIDDLITRIPRLSYEKPHGVMVELLRRRHLSPAYGKRSPIAPEKEDYLVIDEVPDVLHSGHVHTFGTTFYRGVFVVNSSTWQSQTEFQRKMNLNPMPGIVSVYNGERVAKLKFA